MPNNRDPNELSRVISAAEDLHKQKKYAAAEAEYKRAFKLVPSYASSRANELNARLLRLYAESKQKDRLHLFLGDKQSLSFFTSREGAQFSSAIINTWLKEGYYVEARQFAVQLLPNLQWLDEPCSPIINQPGVRSCGIHKSSESVPSYNLRVWSETCNTNGKPEEAEKLFDACIKSAIDAQKEHTEQYVLICSLAAIESVKLDHFDKVNVYFETAFAAGKDMEKPPFWELFSAAQRLLPKNLEMASTLFTKLFPYSQDKVYELTLKLDLASEFAKHNQKEKAKQLASEVDSEIRNCIDSEAVAAEYKKYVNDKVLAAPVVEREKVLIDRLIWFPRAGYFENGVREISSLTVLRALQWDAIKTADFAREKNLLKMELDLLVDSETQTQARKVYIYKKLAQLVRLIDPKNETVAADYEDKARTLNKDLKENRGCYVP